MYLIALRKIRFIIFLLCIFFINFNNCANIATPTESQKLKINKIILNRKNKNNYLTDKLIYNSIPYKAGEIFNPHKTSILIHNLYDFSKPFSYFEQIRVMGKLLDNNTIDLYIITNEKYELADVIIKGNTKVTRKEIFDKFKFEDIHAINEIDLQKIVSTIKRLYRDKDFHCTDITAHLEVKNNKATAYINIQENKKSLIKRVFFRGNNNISSKRLRSVIFTKENWIFGFVNKAGSYRSENVEQDKFIIESYYKSHGYFMAKVINVDIKLDPNNKQYYITFDIQEGDLYTVKEVKAPGNEVLSEEILLSVIPIKPCDLYSAKDIRDSLEALRTIWGQYGYVFADIDPLIIPDEKNKTVSITFNSELGDKVFVNRINILGNRKTKDYVIRRKLNIEEGDLLTTLKMDSSKDRVENLGFFDPNNGVNWKINRIDNGFADLDLIVNEVKTGKVSGNMGVGGSPTNLQSVTQSFRFGGSVHDTNLFGEGILLRASGEWSSEEWTLAFNALNPWTFNKPIFSEVDIFVTKSRYTDELKNTSNFTERVSGAFVGGGFTTSYFSWLSETGFLFKFGIEDIKQSTKPLAIGLPPETAQAFQTILDRRFQSGAIWSLTSRISQDMRNHTLHPSRGYQWNISSKVGLSGPSGDMGYGKLELEGSIYTPLIGDNKLILGVHGFFGIVGSINDKIIPYRELFHIGGPASVRGYNWGQISPTFLGDSIGGKKAFFINTELIFPITKDFSIKGAIFYDGGAGWDTPDINSIPVQQRHLLRNNNFEFRQAIGFGIRMLKPTAIKVDWGFKLDRRKGEKSSELHLSAYRDF